jgi:DNA polymerase-4
VLVGLVDRVTGRMRTAGRVGRTVVVRLRFDDFSRATRSHTLPSATAATRPVLDAARALLAGARPLLRDRGLTLLGIAVANLDDADAVQLTLPFDGPPMALDTVVDRVKERFGAAALTRGVLLDKDPGWEMPRLPD